MRGLILVGLLTMMSQLMAAPLQFESGRKQVTLLELYTSEGCSSCPPAERYLNKLVTKDALWTEVVPLAFHVDYWDYIGWKDRFASPEYGARQRELAAAGNARTVYTPGFFANGQEWRGWVLRRSPGDSNSRAGNLSVTVDVNSINADYSANGSSAELHIAVLGFGIETDVKRGENRGRKLAQEFVVLGYEKFKSTDGRWQAELPAYDRDTAVRLAIAAWVSPAGQPEPLQATGGWLQ